MRAAEVAALAGVCLRTLRRWVAAGCFPSPINRHLRGHWRFRRVDVERWQRGEWPVTQTEGGAA
jgi:excisionase family DNA binding protein